ncbi:MAG TPA: hypothetical protein VJ506_05615, partial [Candidatus Limnocylindrales bacterium]|nr:hypothetical protein [Candidatus Limnocylindrales bacterium]
EGYRAARPSEDGSADAGVAAGVVVSTAAGPMVPNPDLIETVVAAGAAASTASPTVLMWPEPTAPAPATASAGDVVSPSAGIGSRPTPRTHLGRSTALALTVAILILVLALIALANAGGIGSPLPTQPLASPSASLSASPSPSPGPSPSPSPDPAGPALQALDAVTAAIDQARGGKDGLSGAEAHDLDGLAADVGSALRAADYAMARQDAATLAARADRDTRNLDPDRRAAILNAIDELQAAIPSG